MRVRLFIGCCSSSLSAPLCRSPATNRIATNGNRNAAASSHALNVGAQIPISGENASPTPTDVPFNPLASAYVWTALMNETPVSGPMRINITHHAREATSSRHSLATSTTKMLRERKEDLFEIVRRGRAAAAGDRGELGERAFAADAAVAEQHEPIAHARGVVDLVNRQEQRAAGRG